MYAAYFYTKKIHSQKILFFLFFFFFCNFGRWRQDKVLKKCSTIRFKKTHMLKLHKYIFSQHTDSYYCSVAHFSDMNYMCCRWTYAPLWAPLVQHIQSLVLLLLAAIVAAARADDVFERQYQHYIYITATISTHVHATGTSTLSVTEHIRAEGVAATVIS